MNPSGGCSLPTTGRPVPPRSMWTVFPAGKSAAIMHDEVTSVAPSSTINVMRRPIRPLPGDHALEDESSVRPGGRLVLREDARYIICRTSPGRATLIVDRHIRGRRLADPEGPFHPGPGFQVDDSASIPTRAST